MSDIPLRELVEEVRDRVEPTAASTSSYVGLEHLGTCARAPIAIGAATDVSSTKAVFREGDVLFGKLRPYLRKVAMAQSPGICSTDILVFRPRQGVSAVAAYVALASPAVAAEAVARATGTRMPRVSADALLDVRVSGRLLEGDAAAVRSADAADELLQHARRHADAARHTRNGLRDHLLAAHADKLVAVGDVTRFARGQSFPRSEQGATTGTYPVFKVADMNVAGNERVLMQAENWLTEAQRERLGFKLWPKDTVVFARVGAALQGDRRRLLGRVGGLDDNMIGLIAEPEGVDPYFLLVAMERVPLAGTAQQGAVPSVNARMVNGSLIPLPPLDEQRKIGELMRAADEVERHATEHARNALAVREALFDAAARTETLVPA